MTTHSSSILSELKMSSFGLYAGAKTGLTGQSAKRCRSDITCICETRVFRVGWDMGRDERDVTVYFHHVG